MFKFTKGFCGMGAALLTIGIVMLVIGFSMGGKPQGISLGWDNGPVLRRQAINASNGAVGNTSVVTVPPLNADTIHSLVVKIGAADVEIRNGNEFSLDVQGDVSYSSTVNSGTWLLESNASSFRFDLFGSNSPRYVLTVPTGFSFEMISLELRAGTLRTDSLHTHQSNLAVGAGTMKLTGFVSDSDSIISVGMGTLTLNGALEGYTSISTGFGTTSLLLERPTVFGYRTHVGLGTIRIDGRKSVGTVNSVEANNDEETFYDIDCGMGTVTLDFANSSVGTQETLSEKDIAPAAGTGRNP